jgi:hypothetical protein
MVGKRWTQGAKLFPIFRQSLLIQPHIPYSTSLPHMYTVQSRSYQLVVKEHFALLASCQGFEGQKVVAGNSGSAVENDDRQRGAGPLLEHSLWGWSVGAHHLGIKMF